MTKYIWKKESHQQRDLRVCFRRTIIVSTGIIKLDLSIWADSRYYLWVNGDFISSGPSRSWPDYPQKDNHSLVFSEPYKELCIGILVWHYGTSTSQYVHGDAGLAVCGTVFDSAGGSTVFHSDENWKCRKHGGYLCPAPRINVSQPAVEVFNASAFPENWMQPGFDDSSWSSATPKPAAHMPLESMPDRDIPLLSSQFRKPRTIVRQQSVRCHGTGVRVDYKQSFYPCDTGTEDRLQSGYICCLIDSPVEQNLLLTFADRLWPETDEYVILNGVRLVLKAGGREIETVLKKGKNLFMLDVSGARQRFTADLHFKTGYGMEFLPPLPGDGAMVVSVGPFDSVVIGNIVCADGFEIDMNNPDYISAGQCATPEDLEAFSEQLHPVENVLFDGVKLKDLGADFSYIDTEPLPVGEEIILQASDGDLKREIILDMGGEVSGFLCFNIEADTAGELDFRFFEYLSDGIPEIPDDLDTSLRYRYSPGTGKFRSLLRRGFRFIAIRNGSESGVVISDFYVDEQLFPLERKGSFRCGDSLLNDIWNICRRTVELCSEDALVDSPAFEQAFWTGDAYVMARYHQYLFGDTRLIRHCLQLAAQSMTYTELPDCHLPAGVHLLLTAWAQLWMLAARDYWVHTADKEFIRSIYPDLVQAASVFLSYIDERGVLKIDAWNMLDWAGMDTPYKGAVAHLNARLAACFRAVSELAEVLDYTADKRNWIERAAELAARTDNVFWNQERGCYIDCVHDDGTESGVVSVQTNLMMMIYGCVPPEREDMIKSFIVSPPGDAVRPGSPFLAHFYYEYLFSNGMGEAAVNGIREQWQPMLETGCCWETFIGFYKDRLTRSYCHAWSSAPSCLFGAWVLGIRPLEPGFKKIIIAPQCSGLNRAEGSVPIPEGEVSLVWESDGDVFRCDVRLPENIRWVFEPPEGSWKEIVLRINDQLQELE